MTQETAVTDWTETDVPSDACSDAVAWLRTQPDAATAWRTCERGDWMLWLAGRRAGRPGSDARRVLVLAACDCAELARPHWRDRDVEVLDRCLTTARRWARGEGGVTPKYALAAREEAGDV